MECTCVHIPSIDPRNRSDLGCLSLPQLGPGFGCCNSSSVTDCSVQNDDFYFSSACYCDEACYYFDNCCDDIHEIGCLGKLPNKVCLHLHITHFLHICNAYMKLVEGAE